MRRAYCDTGSCAHCQGRSRADGDPGHAADSGSRANQSRRWSGRYAGGCIQSAQAVPVGMCKPDQPPKPLPNFPTSLPSDQWKGNNKAPVTLYEYSDFQ